MQSNVTYSTCILALTLRAGRQVIIGVTDHDSWPNRQLLN